MLITKSLQKETFKMLSQALQLIKGIFFIHYFVFQMHFKTRKVSILI